MRFLSMIRIDEKGGVVPSEQLMSDMGKLIAEMTREGTLISTAGLRPTAEGVRVRLRSGKLSTRDGPFSETKEVIGGFAILEAGSMQEAIEQTKRFLRLHGDEWDIECEVRQMEGPDFGDQEFTKLDKNKDGVLDKAEATMEPKVLAKWAEADANKDGKISKEEFLAFERKEHMAKK